jgi:NADP-dependent alcohol dehydrogenase
LKNEEISLENFAFYNPVKIIFGKNQITELSNEIPNDKRILIIYGGGSIKKNNVYDQVKKALQGYTVFEFGGIEPNPRYETLMKAVQFVRQNNVDFILAVGGGSVIDGTKFIVAAVNFDGEPWDFVLDQSLIKTALPFATVLTLPAAGSEMNCNAVVSRGEDKLAFRNSLLYPKFSILDPETTYTLPNRQTSNGIIDTFVHVMEQYLTYPVNSPLQARWSEGILLTLIEEGSKALRDPHNYDVRANIMWCSTMALNGLLCCGVPDDWSTHRLGHQLTALHGLDHGQTLAILLPSVMYVKRDKKREKLLQYAERVWNIDTGSDEQKISQAIKKTREFFETLGVKTHLKDYNISEEFIPKALALLKKHGFTAMGEHQDITLRGSEVIYKRSL